MKDFKEFLVENDENLLLAVIDKCLGEISPHLYEQINKFGNEGVSVEFKEVLRFKEAVEWGDCTSCSYKVTDRKNGIRGCDKFPCTYQELPF